MKASVTSPRADPLLAYFKQEKKSRRGLSRIRRALAHINHPEKELRTLVVGGTNGKGTTSLFLSSILKESGCSVATFLSPHLQSLRERFLWDLELINETELVELVRALHPIGQKFSLSYFEFCTLLFLSWAQLKKPDFVVLEVGMGGRLDATNITAPVASVLTNVSLDHEQWLGKSCSQILREKLPIIPKNGLLFTGISSPVLKHQVQTYCQRQDAIPYFADALPMHRSHLHWGGQTLHLPSLCSVPLTLTTPMQGAAESARLAVLLSHMVFPRIGPEIYAHALASVVIPGRMELLQNHPRIVLSGDHNPAGLIQLLKTLKELEAKPVFVCGIQPDKKVGKMLRLLKRHFPQARLYTLCPPLAPDVCLTPTYRKQMPQRNDAQRWFRNIAQSISQEETLIVTGSLYLVGWVRQWFQPHITFWTPQETRYSRKSEKETLLRMRQEGQTMTQGSGDGETGNQCYPIPQ